MHIHFLFALFDCSLPAHQEFRLPSLLPFLLRPSFLSSSSSYAPAFWLQGYRRLVRHVRPHFQQSHLQPCPS